MSELRNRFDPAARGGAGPGHAAPLPVDMGKPSSTVMQITNIFEHKARAERRKVRHDTIDKTDMTQTDRQMDGWMDGWTGGIEREARHVVVDVLSVTRLQPDLKV